MDDEILCEVKRSQLESGLRGIPAGYCVTSTVHPEKGLFYVDHPIAEIADWRPEHVIYLLHSGKEGAAADVNRFASELKARGTLHPEAVHHIERLPKAGHPMALFSAAILIAGIFEKKDDYREDCLNLIAKIPHIAAAVINYHSGWGNTPEPNPELGYMENFVHMLQVPNKRHEELNRVMKLFNILHYDHGGGNLSAFVGKAVASGLEDLYGSIAAAMNALAGPRHGGANQECLHFVEEALDSLGPGATSDQVEAFIRGKLEKKELIYGFGHAVLRVEDPRATVQYKMAAAYYSDHPLVKMALLIRQAGSKVLKENPKISDPYVNVDAISGTLLQAAGFTCPEYYTLLFGVSRTVGIAIQIVYERCEARGGKGTPIIRPKYIYKKRAAD